MSKCDVIIPIYNAYDCVVACLESIIKNTDLTKYRVIAINDASPDKNIGPMLEEYSKKYKNIVHLENKKNKGFVGTVNVGMKYSDTDVLLLNSDTEVTPGWLDRIVECAYSENGIGTVTALSNNATLVSVPKGLQPNDLPSNITLDEYGEIVKNSAYNEKQELPTAHGFCMFIKREVLNTIGYFDEEKFGKGYGEENDFSFRCLDYGYKNVLCDSVLIYHKEKQSFSEAREKLVQEHEKILMEEYPNYHRQIASWCQGYPLHHVCRNIEYNVNMYKRKNVLIVIHDWSNITENIGGTTLHVWDLISNLRKKANFHVLAPENGIYKLYSYFENNESVIELDSFNSYGVIPRYNSAYKKMVENVVDAFGIDHIHIHHMLNHYFDLQTIIKERKIKSSITIHDYYPICPTINMLYKMESFCENEKNKNCKECIKYKTGIKNDVIESWQKLWNDYLKCFNNVFVPSEDTKKRIAKTYKDIDIKVIEHGIDLDIIEPKEKDFSKRNINVAFVGVCSIHKGGKVLEELIKKSSGVTYHLFGISELPELQTSKGNFINHGKYKRSELPKLLVDNNIDVICSLAIWPETYSYTLTEVVACGIPVISYQIGAIADRIKKYGLGWTVPLSSSVDDILAIIMNVNKNDEYKEKQNNIKKYHIKTTKEMAAEYLDIYKLKNREHDYEKLRVIIKNSFDTHVSVNNIEYYKIVNSLRWRIASRIRVPNIVKKGIRKIIK